LSRDIFSRVVLGARVSIEVGFIAVAIGVGSGSLVGIISGYMGGKLDMGLQRLMDALMAFPTLVLAMALTAILKPEWFAVEPWLPPGMVTVMVAIGIVILPSANRVVRGATMSIKENQYVEAARALGASNTRIMGFHILPNLVAPILVMASIVMGLAIIVEASLSFLGLGIQPPSISWGRMVNEGRPYMELAPWMVVAPAAAISVIVLAFNLLGDALRDYFDPSLRGR
jgi:ABC-type dipeptide/oligopeptide/nickel transport system permease subunit